MFVKLAEVKKRPDFWLERDVVLSSYWADGGGKEFENKVFSKSHCSFWTFGCSFFHFLGGERQYNFTTHFLKCVSEEIFSWRHIHHSCLRCVELLISRMHFWRRITQVSVGNPQTAHLHTPNQNGNYTSRRSHFGDAAWA